MDDNLFDEDDALDIVMYEECEKERKNIPENSGCLGVMIFLLILPVTGLLLWRHIV